MNTSSLTWCWTWNNYTVDDLRAVVRWSALMCSNYVIGEEVSGTGTPHLQGFWYFKRKKVKKDLIEKWGSHLAHLRTPSSTISTCMKYCAKDLKFHYKYTRNNKVRWLEWELPRWHKGLSEEARVWLDVLYDTKTISTYNVDLASNKAFRQVLKYLTFSGYGFVIDDITNVTDVADASSRCKIVVYIGKRFPGISLVLGQLSYPSVIVCNE